MTQLSAERFQDAERYTAYLRTIRAGFAPTWDGPMFGIFCRVGARKRALDAGGGSGVLALRLAALGFNVDLLDSSQPMLALAKQEAEARALSGHISFHQADVRRVSDLFEPSSFDLVVCHNLLEYLRDSLAVLRKLVELLRTDAQSILSLLVRNRFGEVLKAAVKAQDLELAKTALSAETILDSLYGQAVRVFDPVEVREIAESAGLQVLSQCGVRVIADYLDCESLTEDAYRQLLDFELLLGVQPQLAAAARYTQIIARPSSAKTSEAN